MAQGQKVRQGCGGEMLSVGWTLGEDAKTRGGTFWQKGPKLHQSCGAEGWHRGVERDSQVRKSDGTPLLRGLTAS